MGGFQGGKLEHHCARQSQGHVGAFFQDRREGGGILQSKDDFQTIRHTGFPKISPAFLSKLYIQDNEDKKFASF